ncbi:MAG: hypothetical protein J1F18_08965 [Lachnospiraceae bacterium]|nr:hypothetical protein [Lachnospiraceae bacterium]
MQTKKVKSNQYKFKNSDRSKPSIVVRDRKGNKYKCFPLTREDVLHHSKQHSRKQAEVVAILLNDAEYGYSVPDKKLRTGKFVSIIGPENKVIKGKITQIRYNVGPHGGGDGTTPPYQPTNS